MLFGLAISVELVGSPQVQIHSKWPVQQRFLIDPTHGRVEAGNELVSRCVRANELFINKHDNWAYTKDIYRQNRTHPTKPYTKQISRIYLLPLLSVVVYVASRRVLSLCCLYR